MSHSLRLGERGVSEGPAPDGPSEVLVHLHSAAVLEEIRIPRSALAPVGKPMSPLRLWDKCSDSVKRELLRKIGVRDPRDEALPESPWLSLTMWAEYLPVGSRLDEKPRARFVQPMFVRAFHEGAEVLETRLAKIEAWVHQFR